MRPLPGCSNSAYLFDGPGNDNFFGTPSFSYLQGGNYLNDAIGFNAVYTYATAGGTNNAYLFKPATAVRVRFADRSAARRHLHLEVQGVAGSDLLAEAAVVDARKER